MEVFGNLVSKAVVELLQSHFVRQLPQEGAFGIGKSRSLVSFPLEGSGREQSERTIGVLKHRFTLLFTLPLIT